VKIRHRRFLPGDEVAVTGCGTSETIWGGYSPEARIPAEFIVNCLPPTAQQAMGVAPPGHSHAMRNGFGRTRHGSRWPGDAVTGAGGGVGSVL